MKVSLVVAAARNGVIGGDGALPWRISDDLKWFRKNTLAKPVLMGRKTFQSIGKALPGRDNIVLTRMPDFSAPRMFVARTLRAGLALADACARERGAEEICIIGGGDIYRQTLAQADRIYLTCVDAEPDGDAFLPTLEPSQWRAIRAGGCEKSAKNEHRCEFFILDREGASRPNSLDFDE